MLLPSPQIRADRITIGRKQEITIESATVPLPLTALFDEHPDFDEAQLTNVKIDQSALPRFAVYAQPRTADKQVNFSTLKFSGVSMTLGNIELPLFDAVVTLAPNGAFRKALIQHPKVTLDMSPVKDGAGLRVNFNGKGIQPAFGPPLEYLFLTGSAVVDLNQAAFSNVEARVGSGTLNANFNLTWPGKFRAQGEFSLKGGDIAQLLPAFTRDFQASGTLDLNAKFSSQGDSLDSLFEAPTMSSTFSAGKGALNNIDLVRAMQSRGRLAQRGGRTAFNEISGDAQAAAGRIALRNLKLTSGPMNGSGSVDVTAASERTGRLDVVLGSQAVTIARGTLNLGGSLKDPQLTQ